MSLSQAQLIICIALGLAPGAYLLWSALRARPDDAVWRERHFAVQRTVGKMMGFLSVIGILAGTGGFEPVTIGAMTAGMLVGNYPARRALWGETWSFLSYAGHALGRVLVQYGTWMLIGLGPLVVFALPGGPAVKSFAYLMVMAGWSFGGARLHLALLSARPLQDAALLQSMAEIAARSKVAMPGVYAVNVPGGTFANALAMYGRPRSAVVFGQTLLDTLTPAESAAIFAHEQGHLEQHAAGEARQLTRVIVALVILAAAVIYFADGSGHITAVDYIWLSLTALAMGRLRRHHKQHEVASDRRAVELCGDAETYAQALAKVHALARLPRRWGDDFEKVASHPSLARRLAAIRGARADEQAVPLLVLADAKQPGLVLLLDGDGCRWFAGVEGPIGDGVPTTGKLTARLPYPELVDLHVTSDAGGAALTARTRTGDEWTLLLRPDDVARVQAHLDRVDHRLSTAPTGGAPQRARKIVLWLLLVLAFTIIFTLFPRLSPH